MFLWLCCAKVNQCFKWKSDLFMLQYTSHKAYLHYFECDSHDEQNKEAAMLKDNILCAHTQVSSFWQRRRDFTSLPVCFMMERLWDSSRDRRKDWHGEVDKIKACFLMFCNLFDCWNVYFQSVSCMFLFSGLPLKVETLISYLSWLGKR